MEYACPGCCLPAGLDCCLLLCPSCWHLIGCTAARSSLCTITIVKYVFKSDRGGDWSSGTSDQKQISWSAETAANAQTEDAMTLHCLLICGKVLFWIATAVAVAGFRVEFC